MLPFYIHKGKIKLLSYEINYKIFVFTQAQILLYTNNIDSKKFIYFLSPILESDISYQSDISMTQLSFNRMLVRFNWSLSETQIRS